MNKRLKSFYKESIKVKPISWSIKKYVFNIKQKRDFQDILLLNKMFYEGDLILFVNNERLNVKSFNGQTRFNSNIKLEKIERPIYDNGIKGLFQKINLLKAKKETSKKEKELNITLFVYCHPFNNLCDFQGEDLNKILSHENLVTHS